MDDSYFYSFPTGYRFRPTHEDLIFHYLMKKVKGEPSPPHRIFDVDLYQYHPEYLTSKYYSLYTTIYYLLPLNPNNGNQSILIIFLFPLLFFLYSFPCFLTLLVSYYRFVVVYYIFTFFFFLIYIYIYLSNATYTNYFTTFLQIVNE